MAMSTMPIKYAVPAGSARTRLLTACAARYTGCTVRGWDVWDGLDTHPASQNSGRFGYSFGKTRSIGTPFVIGHMVQHMTDQPNLHLGGQDGGHDRAIHDLSTGTSRRQHRAHARMGVHRIHMLEVLQQKTGEVPSAGPPIDRVRLGRIGGK